MEETKVFEEETVEVEEIQEPEKVGFFKKHGKKIAVGAAIVGGVVLGAIIGKKVTGSNCCEDLLDAGFSEVGTDE